MMYGGLKKNGYRPRVLDAKLEDLLSRFGGVEVQGPKFCGKTWTSLAFGGSLTRVSDFDTRRLVQSDPHIALQGAAPVVIDEWQEVPRIWDCVRDRIDDESNAPGQFILTGSSTPRKNEVFHSGAGRIATLKMSTMTLFELGRVPGGISLAALFEGEFEALKTARCGLDFYATCIRQGGWPSQLGRDGGLGGDIAQEYLDAVLGVSVPAKGGKVNVARALAMSLARNLATSVTMKTLAGDISNTTAPQSAPDVVRKHLDIFGELYLIDNLYGWDAPVRSRSRVRISPKRYFSDVSLAASLLGFDERRILQEGQIFGLLFESLVMHDLAVFSRSLQDCSARPLAYYRDSDGLEVDAIIELKDGRWAGIEVKLGEDKVADGLASLARLRRKVALNPAARNPRPAFLAVLTGVGEYARYDKEHDAYVIPFSCLQP